MCVYVCLRERERDYVCVYVCMHVCVCVCMRARERGDCGVDYQEGNKVYVCVCVLLTKDPA